jgi:hypothetical protein
MRLLKAPYRTLALVGTALLAMAGTAYFHDKRMERLNAGAVEIRGVIEDEQIHSYGSGWLEYRVKLQDKLPPVIFDTQTFGKPPGELEAEFNKGDRVVVKAYPDSAERYLGLEIKKGD